MFFRFGVLKNKIFKVEVKLKNNASMIEHEQIKLLHDYASRYGETLLSLNPEDISSLYNDKTSIAYNVNQTAFNVIAGVRSLREKDLILDYIKVDYCIMDAQWFDDKVKIWVVENNIQKFKFMSKPSYSYNINHWFTLEKVDGNWYIKEHEHEEDFYLLTCEVWNDISSQDATSKGQLVLETILNDAKENIYNPSQFQQGEYIELNVSDSSYDRKKVVSYAEKWCNNRNPEYSPYDDLGGNCQNFASQCIHAGGINMDCNGVIDLQWKYYGDEVNPNQATNGRSYSWTGVDMFYTYVKNNYSDGLVSLTDIDYNYAQPGDIIHVGAYNDWRHALVITNVKKNRQGEVEEIIVASNTADRFNYPLSAYIYTAARLIHILGQN